MGAERMLKRRRGATAVGYGLLVGLIGVVIIGAVAASGGALSRLLGMTANYLEDPSSIPDGAALRATPASVYAGTLAATGTLPLLGPVATVTVTNSGDLRTGALSVTASGDAQLAGGDCSGRQLGAGESCTVSVQARAVANGPLSGGVTVTDGSHGVTVPVTGSASGFVAALSLGSGDLVPTVTGSGPGECTALPATNTGTAVLDGLSFAGFTGPQASAYSRCSDIADACADGATLAPGASCNFGVALTAGRNGSYPATVTVTASGDLSASRAVAGTASGLAAAPQLVLTAEPPAIAGTSPSACAPVTLSNAGNATAQVTSAAIDAGAENFALCAPADGTLCAALPFELAAADTCLLGVQLAATTNADFTGNLTVGYLDLASEAEPVPATTALSLTGTASGLAPSLAWRNGDNSAAADGSALGVVAPPENSGSVDGAPRSLTLVNSGSGSSATLSLVVEGDYVLADDSCSGSTLAPAASCTVNVFARADGDGALAGTLSATAEGPMLALSGTASGWPGALSWLSADGTAAADGSAMNVTGSSGSASGTARSFTLRNTGPGATGSIAVSVSDPAHFTLTGNCAAALAPGAGCTVTVTPTANAEAALSATLTAVQNQIGVQLALSGSASGWPGALAWFAADGSSAANGSGFTVTGSSGQASGTARSFVLRNTGAGTANGLSVTVPSGASSFSHNATACSAQMAPGASCTVTVTPRASGDGALSGTLRASLGGTNSDIALSGTASGWPANLMWYNENSTATGASIGQGMNVAGSGASGSFNGTVRTFTLHNAGSGSSGAVTVALSNTDNFTIVANTCGASMAPSATCQVTLSPRASGPGAIAGTLTATPGNGTAGTQALSGTASGWSGALAWYFNNVPVASTGFGIDGAGSGGTRTNSVTMELRNGGAAATGVSFSSTNTAFTVTGSCVNATVAAGGSCNATITGTATGPGTLNGTVTATAGSGTSPTLNVSATASNWNAQLVWRASDGSSAADGSGLHYSRSNAQSTSRTFTVRNLGPDVAQTVNFGSNNGSFAVSANCSNLAVNATCAVTVTSGNSGTNGNNSGQINASGPRSLGGNMGTLAVSGTSFLCPSGWAVNMATQHCYSYTGTALTQSGAAANCNGNGAYLAAFGDAAEEAFVRNITNLGDNVWIGLYRVAANNNNVSDWAWYGGNSGTYRNWGGGEPNNAGGENCTHFRAGMSDWNDIGCEGSAFPSVCEHNGLP